MAGLAVLLALAAGNRSLLLGWAAPHWDAADFFEPSFALAGDEIRAGHLLIWNPWSAAGSPDWAEPQLGSNSPLLLAASFLFTNPQAGFLVYWMAIWAFGGIGMLVLARHLGAPAWGGAIAALGFATSGFYTGHAEHTPFLYSVSFLPWIFWRLDAGIARRDWWCGAQAGLLYGLSVLGGYPAYAIATPLFLFLWVLGRALCAGDRADRRGTVRIAAVLLAATVVLGVAIASFPLWGMLSGARGYSDRIGPRTRDEATSSDLLPAGALSTFASPYLAEVNAPPKPLWPAGDVSVTSVYTGAASLLLAVFACRRKNPWRWWLAGMAIFGLCCALGSQLPLRGWLYDFVPPTRYFRHPALLRAYVLLLIAILAALGARDLQDGTASGRDWTLLFAIAAALAAAAIVSFVVVTRMALETAPQYPAARIHLAVVWLGLAALAFLLRAGSLSPARFLQAAMALAFLDAVGALYLSQPIMYTPDSLPPWRALTQRHNPSLDLTAAGLARDLRPPDYLGAYSHSRNQVVKISVLDGYVTLWNRFQRAITDDPLLSRMATGSARLWFASNVAWRPPDNATFRLFTQRVHALDGAPVLVLHSPQQMLDLTPFNVPEPPAATPPEPLDAPACAPASVTELHYTPEALSFRYDAPARGFLLVTDRWAPGWQATVNGQSQPVLGVDFIFRAVEVAPGPNAIQFTYRPQGLLFVLLLSWGTMLLIALEQCRRWFARRRAREAAC